MGVSTRTVWRVISENTAIMRSTPIPEAGEIWAYDNVNIMVNVQLLRQAQSAKMIDTRKSNHQRDRIMKPECIHYYNKFMVPVDRSHQMDKDPEDPDHTWLVKQPAWRSEKLNRILKRHMRFR
ncbi:hypothetical protein Bbelb_036400 [Branchiostoma belcheri]|nr:hypothetical protein Bbelb_036400 [Branchiostoma belcheri]